MTPGRNCSTTTSACSSKGRSVAAASGRLEIEREAALAAIEQRERQPNALALDLEQRLVRAHVVAAGGTLDLDDFRTGFRHEQSRQRAWQQGAEVQDTYAVQCCHRRLPFVRPWIALTGRAGWPHGRIPPHGQGHRLARARPPDFTDCSGLRAFARTPRRRRRRAHGQLRRAVGRRRSLCARLRLSRRGRWPLGALHSECVTGDVLGSARCDCGDQLDAALARFGRDGGVLIYLRQEGRGHRPEVEARRLRAAGQGRGHLRGQRGARPAGRCARVSRRRGDASGARLQEGAHPDGQSWQGAADPRSRGRDRLGRGLAGRRRRRGIGATSKPSSGTLPRSSPSSSRAGSALPTRRQPEPEAQHQARRCWAIQRSPYMRAAWAASSCVSNTSALATTNVRHHAIRAVAIDGELRAPDVVLEALRRAVQRERRIGARPDNPCSLDEHGILEKGEAGTLLRAAVTTPYVWDGRRRRLERRRMLRRDEAREVRGAGYPTRTDDLSLTRRLLYQLS